MINENNLTIEKFIEQFNRDIEDSEIFQRGYCYHFSVILNDLFTGSIVYNPVLNHFAFCCEYGIYDVTGKIAEKEEVDKENSLWYFWALYQVMDPIESERIIEQCQYKIYR